MGTGTWLDRFFKRLLQDGTPTPIQRPAMNFVGAVLSDNAALDATTVTISGAVSNVTGTAPITSTGGATPAIGINPATDSLPGSFSAADKTKLDGLPSTAIPTSRQIIAGAGLTGGGDLSADRTLNVVGNADASITVNANDVQVGALGYDRVNIALSLADEAVVVNGQQIKQVGDPTQAQDAATQAYVLARFAELGTKPLVVAIGTANVAALSGLATTVDGVLFGTDAMRVGLAAQSASVENGVWLVHAGAWTRPDDFAAGSHASGTLMFAEGGGTSNKDSGWSCSAPPSADVVDTDSLPFVQFTGLGQVTANGGLVKSGNAISVGANADGSMVVNADDIQVGVLATDVQHGARGGGTQHALAIAGGANGFLSGSDKTKLDTLTSGAAIASVSGTAPIVSSGGTDPVLSINAATTVLPGSFSAADKTKLNSVNSNASVASVSGTAPIAVSTGTTDAIVSIGAATGSLPGSMSAADKTKLDAAVSTAGSTTLALRDGSGGCAFAGLTCTTDTASTALRVGTSSTYATSGALRLPNNLGAYESNAAHNADLLAHIYDASDTLTVGDATNGNGANFDVKTGTSHALRINSVTSLLVGSNAISLGTGTMASAGVLRVAKNFTLKAKNAAASGDLSPLSLDGADNMTLGDASYMASILTNVKTGGFVGLQINSVEAARFDSTQLLMTAPAINFAAAAGAISIAQAQSASGIGSAYSHYAQQGQAGSIGGIFKLGGGLGGTSGTNLSGATQIDLGTAVTNVSARLSLLVGAASILDLYQSSAATVQIAPVGATTLCNLGSQTANITVQIVASGASIVQFKSASIDMFVPLLDFSVGQTAPTIKQADNVTGSATAQALTVQAANATGATSVGGQLNLKSGTGTTNAGAVVISAGATTKATFNATGVGLFASTAVAQPTRAGQLTDSSGGTSGGSTIAAIGGAIDPTAALKTDTANAIATLAARLNLLEGKISAAGTGIGVTA